MFPGQHLTPTVPDSFPRMRGDVPYGYPLVWCVVGFSPHARGCSLPTRKVTPMSAVFPACAGMFLRVCVKLLTCISFPRMRGDVPHERLRAQPSAAFSPHARGCSHHTAHHPRSQSVFPACAGMFRLHQDGEAPGKRFPRMRGDVPLSVDRVSP